MRCYRDDAAVVWCRVLAALTHAVHVNHNFAINMTAFRTNTGIIIVLIKQAHVRLANCSSQCTNFSFI